MSSTQTLRQRPAGQKAHPAGAHPSEAERLQDLAAKLAKSPAFLLALQEAIQDQQAPNHADALDEARELFPEAVDFEVDSKAEAIWIWIPAAADYPAAFMRALDLQPDFDRFGLALHPLPLKAM